MGINQAKIERIKKGKPFSIFDIVAILLALIISLGYIIYAVASREQGDRVEILVQNGGKFYYSLSVNATITQQDIGLKKGNIEIVISDKKIRVRHADCDNHICMHTGAIMYKGQSITCLPLGVHIRILGALNTTTG